MSNQLYSFANLKTAVTHVLAGTPNANNPPEQIVNAALNWVVIQRPWVWRQKPIAFGVTAQTITSMVRGSDGMTVTVVSTAHNLIPGFILQVIGSTPGIIGDTPFDGSHIVVNVIDANTFTFFSSGQPNDTASVPGTFIAGQMYLPSDFGCLYVLKSAPNSFRDVLPTSLEDLVERRQFAYGSTYELFYAVSWVQQPTVTSEPQPMLYLFPTPTAATIAFLQGVYLRRIPMLVNDTDVPDLPGTYGDLLMHACRAFAKSREEDVASEDWRLTMELLAQCAGEDGMNQWRQGKMRSTLHPRTFPVSQFYPNGRITA